MTSAVQVDERVTYGEVLRNREFAALLGALGLSALGDYVARIAVALLVFNRTHSPLLTGVTWAISYLPWIIGGPTLSAFADRLPRRTVMIFCDAARCLTVAAMAAHQMPLWAVLALLALTAGFEPPFAAARAALIPDILEGESYVTGTSLHHITVQCSQVVGFVVGGAFVAAVSAYGALAADAFTFALSAVITIFLVTPRPAARNIEAGGTRLLSDVREGLSFVLRHRLLRSILAVSWLMYGVAIAAEGLAVVYARRHGGGAVASGVLTAAQPFGVVVGLLVVTKWMTPRKREQAMLPMAFLAVLPFTATLLDPPIWVAAIIWAVAGLGAAFQVTANRLFVLSVAPELRGRAFGVANAGIQVSQGAGLLASGAIAGAIGAASTVGLAGAVGAAGIIYLAWRWPTGAMSLLPGSSSYSGLPAEDDDAQESATKDLPRMEPHAADPGPAASVSPKPGRAWLLSACLFAAAAALTPEVVHLQAPLQHIRHTFPWWALAPVFAVTTLYNVHFQFRGQARIVELTHLPLVVGLYLLAPAHLLIARLVPTALIRVFVHRQPPVKATFNLALSWIETVTLLLVFHALLTGHIGPKTWTAAFVASVTLEVVSQVSIAGVIALVEGRVHWRETITTLGFALTLNAVNTSLGLVAVASLASDISTGWALAVVMIIGLAAFRGYRQLQARHDALDQLYAIARSLGPVSEGLSGIGPALSEVRELLNAETLQLAVVGDPDPTTVVTVGQEGLLTTIDASMGWLDDPTKSVLETGRPTLRGRNVVRAWEPWRRHSPNSEDTMAVPLGAGNQTLGVLRVQHRASDIRGFDLGDLRLLEAAAGHLSTALERGQLLEGLRHAAHFDALTSLANLETVRQVLSDVLGGDGGASSGVVVMSIDLHHLQDVNDTLGHQAGDMLLVEVARRLEAAAPAASTAARLGGDQFALILPGGAGGDVARLAALAVKSRLEGPVRLADLSADVRVSIGVSRAPQHGGDAGTLLRRAEAAMRTAKGTANGIVEWDSSMEGAGPRRLTLLTGLRVALTDALLTVAYQPKLRLGPGEVVGMEALVRWNSPELGFVPPNEFVPLAEASGLIGALTSLVLRQALETCRSWHDAGHKIGIAVNLSARSLTDPVLVGQVAALLTATRLDPKWLTLEITESSVMENPARSVEILRQLRSLGIRLAIDDFGTGYSSLTYVKGLPVHELKVDRSFVTNVHIDPADRAVVRSVVDLAKNLGLTTVAEGVEEPEQALTLAELGLDEVQGYFYAKPMPAEAAAEWLGNRRPMRRKNPA